MAQCSGYGAWLLLGLITERSCPRKKPACPAVGGGSEVTFKKSVGITQNEGFGDYCCSQIASSYDEGSR
ncbi:hypothetical protein J6590_064106 [Homalodisca vitripennis]|nr:hypothetical protein J6590_064106 [Homalodisca vitripennis]